jgi:hypothetical protein
MFYSTKELSDARPEHDPKKWVSGFGKKTVLQQSSSGMIIRRKIIPF